MKRTLAAAAALVCLIAPAVAAINAEGYRCHSIGDLLDDLDGRGFSPVATGLSGDGAGSSQVFIFAKDGEWVATFTYDEAPGEMCMAIYAFGEWTNLGLEPPELPGVDS